jgi:hypothetical protein
VLAGQVVDMCYSPDGRGQRLFFSVVNLFSCDGAHPIAASV